MKHSNNTTFLLGYACGAIPSVLIAIAIASSHAAQHNTEVTPVMLQQEYTPGDYFVTGDTSTATLWRRERNGTLTCISINACRRPTGG